MRAFHAAAVVVLGSLLAAGGFRLAGAETRSSLDGVFTEEQAQRGRKLYGEQCRECHGRELQGGYESASLGDDVFRGNWEGHTLDELFRRILVTMSGDTPGRVTDEVPKPLTREQTADLVAFLLWFNGSPAGKTELPTTLEVLRGIRFEIPRR
jgi:S-disulfanyl-L-cysteine oxidoreductase SoxD